MCPFSKSTNTTNINVDSLGHEVRDFVAKYEQGFRQTTQLVSSEALQVREIIVRESGKTEKALRDHVTRTSANFEREIEYRIEQTDLKRHHERLLTSLKYRGMNERANQVENAHARTFRWLFADEDDSSGRRRKRARKPPEPAWSSFTDWLQSSLGVYWIMGKPGSGKSTLSKFILSEPRTKSGLEKWRPGVIMANHYFWRPGSLMQRSIKGMLSSIAHQLVLSVPNSLEYSSTNISRIDQKDADTDWSEKELQQFCLDLIRGCGQPLCLFIDGLDECGPEDDHQKLLVTLESMRLPNVKIIVSSRNEPIFENRFRHEPQLRMQDLTADDLRTYATDMLLHDVNSEILYELLENAEGVFLWLALAVQSLNRGLRNGDSFEDLLKRVRSLPRGLNDLYKDMWRRLNDDSEIYLESAAIYFKLVIAEEKAEILCLEYGWTLLEMMLASFASDHAAFAGRPIISASHLLRKCEEFVERVKIRCAGLLGLYGQPRPYTPKLELGETGRALLEYADRSIRFDFIHRSAHDFLVDTVEGQNILIHDGTSSEDINTRIISARIRTVELLYQTLGDEAHSWFSRGDEYWKALKNYLYDLSRIADARQGAAGYLILRCYEMYRSHKLYLFHDHERPAYAAAFFGEAARYPNLNYHCTSIIETQLVGSSARSAVLLSVATTRHGYNTVKLVRWLLSLPNVDVNLKCPLVLPSPHEAYYSCDPDINGPLGPLQHIKESPFNRLLSSGLEKMPWNPDDLTWNRHTFLGLVSDFAFQGADFRSTLFLAIIVHCPPEPPELEYRLGDIAITKIHQFAREELYKWVKRYDKTPHDILCVVSLRVTSVIKRMLSASSVNTHNGHISINEDKYKPDEDNYSVADLQAGMKFLSQKCQECGGGAKDRVVGFLQPSGNMRDMPYRQVSDRDSARLLKIIWKCIFTESSPHENAIVAAFKEVLKRSPFSSIGFRDYLIDRGCFDEPAARELLREYGEYK